MDVKEKYKYFLWYSKKVIKNKIYVKTTLTFQNIIFSFVYLTSACQASLLRRLTTARTELEFGSEPANFDLVIVNDNLEAAYQQLKGTTK